MVWYTQRYIRYSNISIHPHLSKTGNGGGSWEPRSKKVLGLRENIKQKSRTFCRKIIYCNKSVSCVQSLIDLITSIRLVWMSKEFSAFIKMLKITQFKEKNLRELSQP